MPQGPPRARPARTADPEAFLKPGGSQFINFFGSVLWRESPSGWLCAQPKMDDRGFKVGRIKPPREADVIIDFMGAVADLLKCAIGRYAHRLHVLALCDEGALVKRGQDYAVVIGDIDRPQFILAITGQSVGENRLSWLVHYIAGFKKNPQEFTSQYLCKI